MMQWKIPIGMEFFDQLRENGYYFVDKTPFLQEFLRDHAAVTLLTRPRRFGKTLLLSMMQRFLDLKDAEENRKLFDGLAVSQDAEAMAEQGQRPVIFLTMKNIEWDTWEGMQKNIAWELARLYSPFKYLAQDKMDDNVRTAFESISSGKATLETMKNGFLLLCQLLEAHHGKKAVLLVDEYDAPLQCAWSHGYYDEAIGFFRSLYFSALKSNPSLDFAILTGVLRIAKESIFSGLNNLRVSSALSGGYASACGYTKAEVAKMAHDLGHDDKLEELASWYDGYDFQGTEIYNPWSVNNYFMEHCKARPYWMRTSGNSILQTMLRDVDQKRERDLYELARGGSIRVRVDEAFIYKDVEEHIDNLYTLLLYTGYLKCTGSEYDEDEDDELYTVALPNREIRSVFRREILKYLTYSVGRTTLDYMLNAMVEGDTDMFEECLQDIVRSMCGIHDAAHPEHFYHGLMLGLTVWLEKRYRIRSNRESGYGRFDLAFFPKQAKFPGIVMEFKAVKTEEELAPAVDAACQQIAEKDYTAELEAQGASPIWCYGIAFCKKRVIVKMCS